MVDSLLLVVDCALFDTVVCGKEFYTYIRIICFLITLQEKIDTVTVEGVENVWEEDCIKIKTEEDYLQFVGTVKGEQEVSVLCWCVLLCCVCVCMCVVHFFLYISHLFSFCISGCTRVIRCV